MTEKRKVTLLPMGEDQNGPIYIASICFIVRRRKFLNSLFSRKQHQLLCRFTEIEQNSDGDIIGLETSDSPAVSIDNPEQIMELIRFFIRENLEWPKDFKEIPMLLFGDVVLMDYDKVMGVEPPELSIVS